MSTQNPDDDCSKKKSPLLSGRLFLWWRGFELRDQWWRLLDYFESHRKARRLLLGLFASFLLVVVALVWVYPWWAQRNAISMARQWIAAGRLDNAADSLRRAVSLAPERPETWQLAAELARLRADEPRLPRFRDDTRPLSSARSFRRPPA